jgi:hypothetical protein
LTFDLDILDRSLLKPIEYPGLIRLGLPKDGGYVVPQALVERSSVLVSLGMKQDWSFEKAFAAAAEGVRVIGVDPSVGPRLFAGQIVSSLVRMLGGAFVNDRRRVRKHLATLRTSFDYFRFFRARHVHVRKAASAAAGASSVTLTGLLQMAEADAPHSVFLKMDIEGAEYALIPEIVRCQDRLSAIVAEFHHLGKKTTIFQSAIAQLGEHFRIVHVHGNNFSAYDERIDFPTAVEITFVNRALLPDAPASSTHEYPRPGLDFPNSPSRPDHRLRFD